MGKISFHYNEKADVLDVYIDKPRKAFSEEMDDDLIMRKDMRTKKLIGFTVLNFLSRFKNHPKEKIIVPGISVSALK